MFISSADLKSEGKKSSPKNTARNDREEFKGNTEMKEQDPGEPRD